MRLLDILKLQRGPCVGSAGAVNQTCAEGVDNIKANKKIKTTGAKKKPKNK